jgi:O-antigen/teichoic acid export membrane protein
MPGAGAASPHAPKVTFLRNVAWGWIAVAVNIVIGLVLPPIILDRLGVADYGLWVLLFSALEYLRMLDFGFRAAVVNRVAKARAREAWKEVTETLSTSTVYFLLVGAMACGAAILGRDLAIPLFKIDASQRIVAMELIVIIALSVALRLVLSPFTAALEAFQRFDLVNRAYISALVFRSGGSLVALLSGHGLVAMAWVILVAQIGEIVWIVVNTLRVVPGMRVDIDFVRWKTFIGLFRYGQHSALMVIANMVSLQAPTTIIAFLKGPTDVALFALPVRLLLYSAEALAKVSDVTSSVTAAVDERRATDAIWRLATVTNRHCLALFMPAAIFLAVYGTPLLAAWVGPEIAAASGPLVRIRLIDFVFAAAGQYNAVAVLLGQGKHAPYARAIVLEVMASIAGLFLFVPTFGIVGAAWVMAITVLAARGVYLAILICRLNGFSVRRYVAAIYGRPLLTALPVLLLALALRDRVLSGDTWIELGLAAALISTAYFSAAVFSVLEPEHRGLLLSRVGLLPRR